MKIICDACSAKYSIADEKVAGKVFKIRCKKCSNIIVVRGNTAAEQPEEQPHYDQKETRSYGYDDEAAAAADEVWFLVIDQDQVGPMSDAEVRDRFARGEVDAETYTWREGFTDWSPLGTIEPFTDLASAAPGGDGGAAAAMFGAPASDEAPTAQANQADIFANADGGGEDAAAALFGDAPSGAADGLFGGNGADSSGMGGGMEMSAEAEQRLRGERNENSVLFSLNNLAALASDSSKSSPARPSAAPSPGTSPAPLPAGAPGSRTTATGEGSGLIDIRSMAQVYLDGKPETGAAAGAGSDNSLPVFSGGPGFAAPAPVLLPNQSQSQSNNKMLYIMFGAIGFLVIAAGVLVILVLRGGDDKPVANNTEKVAGQNTPGDEPAAKPDTAADKDTAKKPEGATEKPTDPAKPGDGGEAAPGGDDKGTAAPTSGDGTTSAAKPADKPKRTGGAAARRTGSKKPGRTDSSDKPKDQPKDTGKSPPRSGGGGKCMDEVGCLLADKPPACCSKYTGGGSKGGGRKSGGGGNANLPEGLSKSDIKNGMSKVRSRVASCGSRHPGKGQVKLSIKVAGSGSVSSVSVSSAPNAALGNCVASAVKRAKFPKTQKGRKFSYPFVF